MKSSTSTASIFASCITAWTTKSPMNRPCRWNSSKNDKGELDDVKLIKAFNDDKTPLVFTAKAPIPADARDGFGIGSGSAYQSGQCGSAGGARGQSAECLGGSGESN